jgi:hypothetical protein
MLDDQKKLIPFIVPQNYQDGCLMARGIIRIVPIGAPSTDISVRHDLGRVPNFVLILDSGNSFQQWRRGTVTWNPSSISLQFSNAGTVVIWIV